jgi:hypothetical protein
MLKDIEDYWLSKYNKNIWEDETLTYYDPATGMGNYPIAIYYKLFAGLAKTIPNDEERKKHIIEKQLFFDSCNEYTFPIIYDYSSSRNELIYVLRNKFKNGINRIAFAFHEPCFNSSSSFLNNNLFFTNNDLIDNQTTFSENINFLLNLVKEFNIEYYDFLACNTLLYDNWNKFFNILSRSNVICGASNNKTGNIKYGNDWIIIIQV